MNKVILIGLYGIYALDVSLMLLFSGSKYDWMSDIDPAVVSGTIEDNVGDRFIFLSLILFLITLIQIFFFIKSKKLTGKFLSVLWMIVAIIVFFTNSTTI